MQRKPQQDSFDHDIAKGNDASALLANSLLNETLDKLEKAATERMVDSLKQEEREKAWYSLHAIREFRAELQSLHIGGRLAATRKNQNKGA